MIATRIVAPLEIGLCVSDMASALTFYREALGFTEVSDIDTDQKSAIASGISNSAYKVVRLQLPMGERIKLFSPEGAPLSGNTQKNPPLARTGLAFITIIVDSLTDVLTQLKRSGFEARNPVPVKLRSNVHVALVDDPDGNVIELVEYEDIRLYRSDI